MLFVVFIKRLTPRACSFWPKGRTKSEGDSYTMLLTLVENVCFTDFEKKIFHYKTIDPRTGQILATGPWTYILEVHFTILLTKYLSLWPCSLRDFRCFSMWIILTLVLWFKHISEVNKTLLYLKYPSSRPLNKAMYKQKTLGLGQTMTLEVHIAMIHRHILAFGLAVSGRKNLKDFSFPIPLENP